MTLLNTETLAGTAQAVTQTLFTIPNLSGQSFLFNSANPQVVTVPVGLSVYPVFGVLTLVQAGPGALTIVPGPGVTIAANATSLVSLGQYNIIQLLNIGNDTWIAFGGLGG